MEYDQIQAFLDVVKYGTFTAAAAHTYVSQSYLSHKIKLLEEELKVPLLIRGKGARSIELTSYGMEFINMAQQHQSTWNDMLSLKEHVEKNYLSIGCVQTLSNFTFSHLFINHLQSHDDICLSVHSYHSRDLYQRVETHQFDLAYAYKAMNYTDILLTPIFNESMFLACHKSCPYYDEMDLSELPKDQEIYIRLNTEYEIWHDQHWPDKHYLIRITSGTMLPYLLVDDKRWAIVHASAAAELSMQSHLKVCRLNAGIPAMTCYQISHKYPRSSRQPAMQIFQKEMSEYVKTLRFVDCLI